MLSYREYSRIKHAFKFNYARVCHDKVASILNSFSFDVLKNFDVPQHRRVTPKAAKLNRKYFPGDN